MTNFITWFQMERKEGSLWGWNKQKMSSGIFSSPGFSPERGHVKYAQEYSDKMKPSSAVSIVNKDNSVEYLAPRSKSLLATSKSASKMHTENHTERASAHFPGLKRSGRETNNCTSIWRRDQEWWSHTFAPPIHLHRMALN
jgi:hypothetical protein